MEENGTQIGSFDADASTEPVTLAPTLLTIEEQHESDAYAVVFLNLVLISCILLAYYIKINRIYYMPER